MTRSDILRELLSEYELQRGRNATIENERRLSAEQSVPGLAEALRAREDLFFLNLGKMATGEATDEDIPEKMAACNKRVADLLISAGLGASWLDPVYRCQLCKDSGYVGEPIREMCSCMKRRYFERLCQEIGLPENDIQSYEHWDASIFSNAVDASHRISQRQAMEYIRTETMSWSDTWPETPVNTILLSGKSGLGKTFTLHCMARRMLTRGLNVMLISAFRLLEVARKAYFSGRSDEFDSLMESDVLMIDDLGSEPLFDNVTVTQLFNVLNERMNAGKATVLSSNLTMKEIRERYTERIASRLSDNRSSYEYRFFGSDLRTAEGRT